MRNAFFTTILLSLLLPVLSWAQAQMPSQVKSKPAATPVTATTPVAAYPETAPPVSGRPDSKIENISHEDKGSRIDELRVGGVTKSITVQPKGGNMPPYDLSPEHSRQGSSTGKRGWTVLGF
jgi:hypothetical protein